jgi:TolB-like protein/tetratricopeptide (TPR) repeat protein/DNA-binding winged helix-turn-helix (wHTH) protein
MAADVSSQEVEGTTIAARASLFGPFQLYDCNDRPIALSNRRAHALLALLCLEPDQPLARDQIAALFWSGRFKAQARASLRQCLLELGKALEPLGYPLLIVSRERVGLNADMLHTDLTELELALAGGHHEDAIKSLVSIGSKPLLEDLNFGDLLADWLGMRREQVTARLDASIQFALTELRDAGNPDLQRRLSEAWVARNPAAANHPVSVPVEQKIRVAVLPFRSLANADNADYFADGMVDELITTLGQVSQLLVAGRTSSFHFRDLDLQPAQIAAELGVSHLIEGSVQRQGERVRIHAHLIAGDTGFELWGGRFDGTLDDVFALQDKVALAITAAIGDALDIHVQPPQIRDLTRSRAAYDLYLQGRTLSFKLFGDGALDTAVTLLEQAVALDANFAEAWLLLAEVHQLIAIYTACLDRPAESARMASCIDRALAIKPNLGQAYSLLGLHQMIQNDFVGALDLAFKGYLMEPNNPAVAMRLGSYLMFCGRTNDGMRYIEEAIAQDPIDGRKYMLRCSGQLNRGDIAAAIADGQRSVDLGFPSIHLAVATAAAGHHERAVEQYMQTRLLLNKSIFPPAGTTPMSPEVMDAYWLVAAKGVCSSEAEDREAYCRTLDYLHVTMHDNGDHSITMPTVFMGYTEMLFKTLGQRISPGNFGCLMSIWADIDPIRQIWRHPEFIPFAQRIGMAAAWDKYGWPDLLPPPTNRA